MVRFAASLLLAVAITATGDPSQRPGVLTVCDLSENSIPR
jgi:hypothetical protein